MDSLIWIYIGMFFFGIYFLLSFVILYYQRKKELYDYPIAKKFPKVSFLIPAYNEEENIAETINAALAVEYPKGKKEIIIINDGSTDNTKKVIQKFEKKYSEIKLLDKKNSGKADSLNKAISICKGEFFVVIDADSRPSPDTLLKMIGYFEEDEKVAAVTSRVWPKNKKNFLERFQEVDYVVIAWSRKIFDFIDCVYVTNGPFSVYRKEAVKKVGGFDPTNLTEDVELTWNLLSKGYKTKMSYSTIVYTIVPDKLKVWMNQRIRWNVGGIQTLYKYRKYFLRKGENLFGNLIMTYVFLSFFLAFFGLILTLRFIYLKFSPYIFSLSYFFKGYNPFLFFDFSIYFSILLVIGFIFAILSIWFHKLALKNTEIKRKNIFTILIYIFIYRPLYILPLIISFYKMVRKDIRWYTK